MVLIPEAGPADSAGWQGPLTTATDQNGAFSLKAAPMGAYRVYAWTELAGAAYRNADFMAAYTNDGVAVTISKGARATVTARLLQ